jgi:DNA-binding NarL/FixJ family response regulator
MRILICEDSPTVRLKLKQLLIEGFYDLGGGLEIIECSAVHEGLSFDVDVVLLDLVLGVGGAQATLERIKEFKAPVVVVTGSRSPTIIKDCIAKYGASSYIYKLTAFQEPRVLVLRLSEAIWRAEYDRSRGK